MFSIAMFILSSFVAYGQVPDVSIYEDFSDPAEWMWHPTDGNRTGKIENGMYVSKSKKYPASINFPYGLSEQQKQLNDASDIELEVVKLEGSTSSPIVITLTIMQFNKPSDFIFSYNLFGEWSVYEGDPGRQLGNGKTAVNEKVNLIKITHRKDVVKIYMNKALLFEYKYDYPVDVSWWLMDISSTDKEVVLGLDKAIFKAYGPAALLMEELALQAEMEKEEKAKKFIVKSVFPDGKAVYNGTMIPLSFDYNSSWKLKDVRSAEYLSKTASELLVSKSDTGGYFLLTTDTTSMNYEEYFKKYIDVNYSIGALKKLYEDIADAEMKINGQEAKLREVIIDDAYLNPTGMIELWCVIIKDHKYYALYSICFPEDRATVLSTFNSITILE